MAGLLKNEWISGERDFDPILLKIQSFGVLVMVSLKSVMAEIVHAHQQRRNSESPSQIGFAFNRN